MNFRIGSTLLAVTGLISASLPVATHANETQALDRCVQTFINEVVPADHAVEIQHQAIHASSTNVRANRKKVDVVARGETYGKLFGRATCVIRNGSLEAVYVYGTRPPVAGHSRPRAVIRSI